MIFRDALLDIIKLLKFYVICNFITNTLFPGIRPLDEKTELKDENNSIPVLNKPAERSFEKTTNIINDSICYEFNENSHLNYQKRIIDILMVTLVAVLLVVIAFLYLIYYVKKQLMEEINKIQKTNN